MFEFLKKLIKKTPAKSNKIKKLTSKKSTPKAIASKPKAIASKPKALASKPKAIASKPKAIASKPKAIASVVAEKKPVIFSFSEKIKVGLTKTREKLGAQLIELFHAKKIDESFYEDLEMILLSSDVGIAATNMLIDNVKFSVKQNKVTDPSKLKSFLKLHLTELLATIEQPLSINQTYPFVIMVVGVNGTGKTTSIGKLTKLLIEDKHKILIAAGDTFRAAASEQLAVWGERNDVQVISQSNGDPSAVIFDAVTSAKAKNIDVVIADTAGRLPTQKHLIDEITKIKRVINKCHNHAPQEILLVIDANTGQNAINQLKIFDAALGITGIIITKLDGTAKGGVLAAIAKELPVPIRFIGVGEGIDDLRIFNAADYVEAMFE